MKWHRSWIWFVFAGCPGFGGQSASNGLLSEVPDSPNYDEHVSLIMDAYCVSCHGDEPTAGAPGTFRLDIYTSDDKPGVFDVADRVLIRSENTALPMPPSPPFLDSIELETLSVWLDNGAPENGDGAP